jgi:hypothetical protein
VKSHRRSSIDGWLGAVALLTLLIPLAVGFWMHLAQ